MQTLKISALDTLFFRDGRPFTMGEDTHAAGLFPPPPSVLYGALRTTYMAGKIQAATMADLIKETSRLSITGLAIVFNDRIHFPLPKDLVVKKDDENNAHPLKYVDAPDYARSLTPKTLQNGMEGKMAEKDFYISINHLRYYLRKDGNEFPCKTLPIEKELKVGIGRKNETHIATDGMLYRAVMQRPLGVSFSVQFDNLTLDTEGVLQLGGERKAAHYESENVEYQGLEMADSIDSNEFKIYLATPAIFSAGWKPSDILEEGCVIQAAAIGKPLHLGGFDVEKKMPKPMLQAVPAGSVYYVKAQSVEQAKRMAKKIETQISISEYYPEQGFGIAFIGKV
jgi:CRISPR-associated protein Cmr3